MLRLAVNTGARGGLRREGGGLAYERLTLIEEHGQDLILGKAIPRERLAHGQTVRVQRGLTYLDEMGYTLRSRSNAGLIEAEVELPRHNPPAHAYLRLRHPRQESMRRVEIDGEAWMRFDASSEMIELPLAAVAEGRSRPALHVRAFYG